MTSRDFCYWLQGFFELNGAADPNESASPINSKQAQAIRQHLALVFKHEIDPQAGPASHQAELNKIHDEGKPKPAPASYPFPPTVRC